MFLQGIAGTLELFHLSLVNFQNAVEEATGNAVAVYQRVDQAGQRLPIDERILADTDTLMVFGLDHWSAEEEASPEEIAALEDFLSREGTCLVLGPHHDVGASSDLKVRDMEYHHHGDALVPRQQRFTKYVRSLMKGLGMPVENRYGLRPATHPGTTRPVPIVAANDLDTRGWLTGVSSFVFHMHLPHYALTDENPKGIHVLAASAGGSLEAASVHRGGEPGDQHVPVDAAHGQARGRHPVRRLDDLHDALWRRRKPDAFLEKSRNEVAGDGASRTRRHSERSAASAPHPVCRDLHHPSHRRSRRRPRVDAPAERDRRLGCPSRKSGARYVGERVAHVSKGSSAWAFRKRRSTAFRRNFVKAWRRAPRRWAMSARTAPNTGRSRSAPPTCTSC